jgi:hypothetical protein
MNIYVVYWFGMTLEDVLNHYEKDDEYAKDIVIISPFQP